MVTKLKDAQSLTYTVSRLGARFGLSRTALLYYDSIGLLRPSARTESNYRRYSEKDAQKLEQICRYRKIGLNMKEIKRVLSASESDLACVLEERLDRLNLEIEQLRGQQKFIVGILKGKKLGKQPAPMNKDRWVALLRASGFSDEDMSRWHLQFELTAPEEHQRFLEFLCIARGEIRRIRSTAKSQAVTTSHK